MRLDCGDARLACGHKRGCAGTHGCSFPLPAECRFRGLLATSPGGALWAWHLRMTASGTPCRGRFGVKDADQLLNVPLGRCGMTLLSAAGQNCKREARGPRRTAYGT